MKCDKCGHPTRDHAPFCTWDGCHCRGGELDGQLSLDDAFAGLTEGRRRRDEGTAIAGTGAPAFLVSAWQDAAERALATLIRRGDVFSADDLVELAGEPPVPNMLGGLFIAARRQERIRPVGYRQGCRPAAHARVQRVWTAAAAT